MKPVNADRPKLRFKMLTGNRLHIAHNIEGYTMADVYKEVLKHIARYNISSRRPIRRCYCPTRFPPGTVMIKVSGYTKIYISERGREQIVSIEIPLIPV